MTVATTLHLRRPGVWIIAASLVGIALLTLLPEPPATRAPHYCLICGSFGTVDAALNVVLFVPLGIGLALIRLPAKWSILGACALSIAIELTQLAIPGRDSTIGDVVFNTLGGALGYMLVHLRGRILRPEPRTATWLVAVGCALWLFLQAVFAFSLAINLTERVYYMQIAPVLQSFSVFQGSVTAVNIGDNVMPDGPIAHSAEVRASLTRGDRLSATAIARGQPSRTAPIVRVADAAREEIVLVGQKHDAVIFSERTGATILRLRRPFFALSHAFLGRQGFPDPTTLVARHSGNFVDIQSTTRLHTAATHIPVTTSLAWTLFLPFQWLIGGTIIEQLLGFLWTALLLVPLGLWAVSSLLWFNRSPTRRLLFLAAGAALLVLGLAWIPPQLAISAARPGDWVAALAGLGAGCWVGRLTNRNPHCG